MVTPIEIARAARKDIAAIQAAAGASWKAIYADIFTAGFIEHFLSTAYSEANLAQAIERDAEIFLVARVAGQVAGFAHASPQTFRREWEGDFIAELYRLYVEPSQWRRGLGTLLLDAMDEALVERGVGGYFCFVHGENEVGKAFYQRRNFEHLPRHDRDGEWYMEKMMRDAWGRDV